MRKLAVILFALGAMTMGGCATAISAPTWRPTEAKVAKPDESHDLDELAPQMMVASRESQSSSSSSVTNPAGRSSSPSSLESDPAPAPSKRVAARRGKRRHR